MQSTVVKANLLTSHNLIRRPVLLVSIKLHFEL
jgi:hypothetical protein